MKFRYSNLIYACMLLALPLIFCREGAAAEKGRYLCALTEVIECDRLGECAEQMPETIGLPDFIVIDLDQMELQTPSNEGVRKTKIGASLMIEGKTILSGIEQRGWSAVLSEGNTRLSATISDELVGFILFGVCRAEP